jgi:hypothetical protein
VEDSEKQNKIPEAPDQLHSDAKEIYEQLYTLLIEEDRGDEKYKYSVAIAANSLFYYKAAMDGIDIHPDLLVADIGVAIRTLNAASSEWSRASKALLLTPQAELAIKDADNIPEGDAPPTMAEVMGELLKTKSKNDNYGTKNEQSRKAVATGASTKRKKK